MVTDTEQLSTSFSTIKLLTVFTVLSLASSKNPLTRDNQEVGGGASPGPQHSTLNTLLPGKAQVPLSHLVLPGHSYQGLFCPSLALTIFKETNQVYDTH